MISEQMHWLQYQLQCLEYFVAPFADASLSLRVAEGAVATMFTHPMDVAKMLMQTSLQVLSIYIAMLRYHELVLRDLLCAAANNYV